jgi:hypothetical protein
MARKRISGRELEEIVGLVKKYSGSDKSVVSFWGNKFWKNIEGKGEVSFFCLCS